MTPEVNYLTLDVKMIEKKTLLTAICNENNLRCREE